MKRQILFSLIIIIIIIIIIKTITLKYHLLWLWLELYGFAGSCLIYSMNSSIRNVERVHGLFQGMSTYFSYKTRNRIYSKFTNTLTLPIFLTCELWTCNRTWECCLKTYTCANRYKLRSQWSGIICQLLLIKALRVLIWVRCLKGFTLKFKTKQNKKNNNKKKKKKKKKKKTTTTNKQKTIHKQYSMKPTRFGFDPFNADICISNIDISFNKYRYL